MANNRMFLRCTGCGEKYYLAKYYPSTGWYCSRLESFGSTIEDTALPFAIDYSRFLETHSPCKATPEEMMRTAPKEWVLHGENPDVMCGVGFELVYDA